MTAGERGRWISLNEVFREHENEAARYMSDRDQRLATSTDERRDDRRRRPEPDQSRRESKHVR